MLPANPRLEGRVFAPAVVHCPADQGSHPLLVDGLKGVNVQDALVQIRREERRGIVPAEGEGHLGQVVGAEAEEVRVLGDMGGSDRRAGHFDHRADLDGHGNSRLVKHPFEHRLHVGLEHLQFPGGNDKGNHDLRLDRNAVLGAFHRGQGDGFRLHVVNLRVGNGQPAAPVSQHGVGLPQPLQLGLQVLGADVEVVGQFRGFFHCMRHEFMERGVQEPDSNRPAFHGLENAEEIVFLQGKDTLERGLPLLRAGGGDHGPEVDEFLLVEEHVLRPAEPYAVRAEVKGPLGVVGLIRVGPHPEAGDFPPYRTGAYLIAPAQEGLGVLILGYVGAHQGEFPLVDFAGGAVDGQPIPFVIGFAADDELLILHGKALCAGNAGFAHAPGHHRRVAGLAPG